MSTDRRLETLEHKLRNTQRSLAGVTVLLLTLCVVAADAVRPPSIICGSLIVQTAEGKTGAELLPAGDAKFEGSVFSKGIDLGAEIGMSKTALEKAKDDLKPVRETGVNNKVAVEGLDRRLKSLESRQVMGSFTVQLGETNRHKIGTVKFPSRLPVVPNVFLCENGTAGGFVVLKADAVNEEGFTWAALPTWGGNRQANVSWLAVVR